MCKKIEMGKIKELIEHLNNNRFYFIYLKVKVKIHSKKKYTDDISYFDFDIIQLLEDKNGKYGIKLKRKLDGIIISKSVIEWANDIEDYKGMTRQEMSQFNYMIGNLDKEPRIKSMIEKFCVYVTIKFSNLNPDYRPWEEIQTKLGIDLGKIESNDKFNTCKVKACSDDTKND